MTPDNRSGEDRIVELMPVVDRVVGLILRAGQRRHIDRDELRQVGYVELVRTVRSTPEPNGISLADRVARNVRRAIVRYLQGDKFSRETAQRSYNALVQTDSSEDETILDRLDYKQYLDDGIESMLDVDELEQIYRAVDLLTPLQRQTVRLHFWEDYGVADIARLTGTTPEAVRSRLDKSLKKLRKFNLPGGTDSRVSLAPYGVEGQIQTTDDGAPGAVPRSGMILNRSYLVDVDGIAPISVAGLLLMGVDDRTASEVCAAFNSGGGVQRRDIPRLALIGAFARLGVDANTADELAEIILDSVALTETLPEFAECTAAGAVRLVYRGDAVTPLPPDVLVVDVAGLLREGYSAMVSAPSD